MSLKNTSKLLSITIATMLMSACHNGAMVENMTVGAEPGADFGKFTNGIRLTDAENATRWDSRVSDKNFHEALQNSLYSNDLLNTQNPRYELSANIVQLTPPTRDHDMHVTSAIQYVLHDLSDYDNYKLTIDKTIESYASASKKDEPLANNRKRTVDERAINANIDQFVNYLRR